MRAALGIQALIGDPQPLDRPAANQVLLHNRSRIFGLHAAVPDRLRIDHDHRAMLTLVQAPCLVDSHPRSQPGSLCKLLQLRVQLALSVRGAGWPRRIGRTSVVANKNMALKQRQAMFLLESIPD